MKNALTILAILGPMSSYGNDATYVYTNSDNCTVQVSEFVNSYLVSGSKQVDGKSKFAQLEISKNFDTAKITSYCDEDDVKNTTITALMGAEQGSKIECLNGKGTIEVDLDDNFKVSYFNFTGYHYRFFSKIDDSFSCEGLSFSHTRF